MISRQILSTIVYYDVLDYPLTSFEIWKYLTVISNLQFPIFNDTSISDMEFFSLSDIVNGLENSEIKKNIEEYRGFYFLKGRKDLVEKRLKRNKVSQEKYKILVKSAKLLRFVPFVRMIAATGSLAMKNAENDSDLDLLVVLQKSKIFTGRTLVTFLLHFLRKRRHSGKINDRVCLNYFITDDRLEIDYKDMFSSSEYAFITPLFGFNIFQKFQESNQWIKKYKPNYHSDEVSNLKIIDDNFFSKTIRSLLEKALNFDFIEKSLNKWETKKIFENPLTHLKGGLVSISDKALVFLPEPQGPKIYDKFREKLNSLISKR